MGSDSFFLVGLLLSVGLLVIMTVCVATRIFSSSFEYLFAPLYNYSVVASGSKDSEWEERNGRLEASLEVMRSVSML